MAAPEKKSPETPVDGLAVKIFAGVAAIFFFLTITKLGSPVILDNLINPPTNLGMLIFETWPVEWGYRMLIPLVLAGLAALSWKKNRLHWILVLPLIWLAWQWIAATHTVDRGLTGLTLGHFVACVILFYVGFFAMGRVRHAWPLWTGLALALCWIIHSAFGQHFGGLEATRKMLFSLKNSPGVPTSLLNDPNYLKRLATNRVFATFSNPDALAGCIELILPLSLLFLWEITPKVRPAMRWAFVLILGGCGLACLYWSGSKGGWLVTLVMGIVAVLQSTLAKKWKQRLVVGVLVLGVAGFGLRYAGFFQRQKNSVGARFTYWSAALKTAEAHPVFGTGPGTFMRPYAEIKRPEDEMTRLCHNDYLEQASDSGILGFLAYTSMIIGVLFMLYRYRFWRKSDGFSMAFMVWLGVLGLCLHSAVEYHLYIPALAWPMFFLLGFLLNFND